MTPLELETTHLTWLSQRTFEMRFQRPTGFDFIPGQKIRFTHQDIVREYTLVNGPQDEELAICVRLIPEGRFTPLLAKAGKGDRFQASTAYGYFVFQDSDTPPIFVATGTGIAPFVAFARSGVRQYHLLHGVADAPELYYRNDFQQTAATYTPCISSHSPTASNAPDAFQGRVTDYLAIQSPKGRYDFYLCGHGEMVNNATTIIDQQFEGSRIFTERYY